MINRLMLRSLQDVVLTLQVQTWLNVTGGFVRRYDVTSDVRRSRITMHPLCFQFLFDSSPFK